MYSGDKTPETNPFLAGFAAKKSEEEVELWPENEQAIKLFSVLSTQWRVGMNGPTGLDYNVLFHKMDRMGLDPDEYELLESDIQVIEREALNIIHKKDD